MRGAARMVVEGKELGRVLGKIMVDHGKKVRIAQRPHFSLSCVDLGKVRRAGGI